MTRFIAAEIVMKMESLAGSFVPTAVGQPSADALHWCPAQTISGTRQVTREAAMNAQRINNMQGFLISGLRGQSRRCVLAGICVLWLLLVSVCPCAADAPAADQRANILFILADDAGFSDVGCYGGEIATPNLDALAADGLRYTQFYNTARCWPTRAALMTGYYAQQVRRDALPGLGGGGRGVRQSWARLLPDFLKPFGYRSYHSGKWHIDGKVLEAGFDRSLNVRNQGNFFTGRGNLIDDVPLAPAEDESDYYATTATADHAIDRK